MNPTQIFNGKKKIVAATMFLHNFNREHSPPWGKIIILNKNTIHQTKGKKVFTPSKTPFLEFTAAF
jgi:hypothetical protein